jgi:CubicO group peptidase (beta-lactamase class C family)
MNAGGLSKARLDQMHDVLASHIAPGRVAGLVALVARADDPHVDALGAASFDGPSVRRDSIFRIASMSKPVTAVAAMMLVEEGKLRLDDPVNDLLPELADRRVLRSLESDVDDTVPAHRPITLRDLLTFRFGHGAAMVAPNTYPYQAVEESLGLGMGPPVPGLGPDPDEWIRRFATLPLLHQPGEQWMYNTGSDVLGVLIRRAAGMPFADFLRTRLFEPLGMKNTGFFVPPSETNRFTTTYWTDQQTGEMVVYAEADSAAWSVPPPFPSGAGGLVSTVDDYLAFAQMMRNGGTFNGERVLSRPTVELMTTDQLTPAQKAASNFVPGFFDSTGWGFGVSVVTRRVDVHSVGAYGWDGGLGSVFRYDPREDMITILLTTRAFESPLAPAVVRDFWTMAYAAIDDSVTAQAMRP